MKARIPSCLLLAPVLVACSRSNVDAGSTSASSSSDAGSSHTLPVVAGTSEAAPGLALDGSPLEDPSRSDGDPRATARKPGSPTYLSNAEIRLDRTECYGSCPNYSVVISGNGHVRYIGRTFVKVVGDAEGTLPEGAVQKFVDEFGRVKFVDLGDEYRENSFDDATTYLTLRIGNYTKRVENYWSHGAFDGFEDAEPVPDRQIHEQLDSLAEAIDQAVRIEQWIGTVDERIALSEKLRDGSPGRMEPK